MGTDKGEQTARVSIDGLRVGAKLLSPIYDDESPLLLIAGGMVLTQQMLNRLANRGIKHVRVSLEDLARVTHEVGDSAPAPKSKNPVVEPAKLLPEDVAERYKSPWSAGTNAFIRKVHQPRNVMQIKERLPALNDQFRSNINGLQSVFVTIAKSGKVNGIFLRESAEQALRELVEDMDLFLMLGLKFEEHVYPYSHSLRTSRLAMAMGAVLGLDEVSLLELGLGCLVHDVGMLKIDPSLLGTDRPLDLIEKLDISKHPNLTFEMLKDVPEISLGARMVAYQMHERLDGSGYPRRRVGTQIHSLARIAMVADTFVAMTSPRPHRPAIPPYYAIVELLESAKANQFDPNAVRALITAVGLFPLGSFVELSDGRTAEVLSNDHQKFSKPIVEAWHRSAPDVRETVDLNLENAPTILRPALAI